MFSFLCLCIIIYFYSNYFLYYDIQFHTHHLFRPADTMSASTVAEITRALAASIITNARNSKQSPNNQSIDNQVSATMATAAAQRVAVSISSPNMLGTSSNYNNNNNNNGFVVQSTNSHKKNRRVDDEWKEVTRK